MAESTTISLKRQTKALLEQVGRKGETFDDVIRRLLSEAGLKRLDRRWNQILKEEEFVPLDQL
ncbi:MAG: hypothetical protein QXO51_03585 [Halobacteria archaeon]